MPYLAIFLQIPRSKSRSRGLSKFNGIFVVQGCISGKIFIKLLTDEQDQSEIEAFPELAEAKVEGNADEHDLVYSKCEQTQSTETNVVAMSVILIQSPNLEAGSEVWNQTSSEI